MENNVFFKIVCIDDNDVFEYRINEDTNRKTLDEIHEFVKQNINKSVFINLNKKITPAYKIKGCIIKTVQLQWGRRKKSLNS